MITDKELLINIFRADKNRILEFASDELRDDKEVVLEAVEKDGCSLRLASERLKDDKEFLMSLVKKNGFSLYYASDRLKDDKEVVLEAIKSGFSLYYASDRMKDDEEVVIEAVKKDCHSLRYASERLQKKFSQKTGKHDE